MASSPAFEQQFTPQELAASWKLSEDTIRRLFQDEPGVFTIGDSVPRGKRGYTTLRIPASVVERVYSVRSGKRGNRNYTVATAQRVLPRA